LTSYISQLDLEIKEAQVINQKGTPWSQLRVAIAATADIGNMLIRYRVLNCESPYKEIECQATQTGSQLWLAVDPHLIFDAVVAFDIVYAVGGNTFKDDNNGNYYLCKKVES